MKFRPRAWRPQRPRNLPNLYMLRLCYCKQKFTYFGKVRLVISLKDVCKRFIACCRLLV
jgi:hypothetical protein